MVGRHHFRSRRFVSAVGIALAFVCLACGAFSSLRADLTIEIALPNGTKTNVIKHVTDTFIWYEDLKGFSLMRVKDHYEYARIDPLTGHFIPSGHVYGEVDPSKAGIFPGLRYSSRKIRSGRGDTTPTGPKVQEALGEFNVLVIPIRFADHGNRELPDRKVYDRIFNKNGGDPEFAAEGSVRDYFCQVSYNEFATSAYVLPWIDLPKTEAYYAAERQSDTVASGRQIDEAVHYALDVVDSAPAFKDLDLKKLFDRNADGYLDAVAFLHSGYGAEAGGANLESRIWSNQYQVPDWTSRTGVKARNVAVVAGLHGRSGNEPCHVGVLCHEGAHFAGLPDLYDTGPTSRRNGAGIGYWGLMGSHWGVDRSGNCPLYMTAWEKIQFGWLEPAVIDEPRAKSH